VSCLSQPAQPLLSVSQAGTFTECQRKWGFVYLDGKRPPPQASAALGSSVHGELELWNDHGKLPTSAIALAGLPHAPAPGIALSEHSFKLRTPHSWWVGHIDLTYDLIGSLYVPALEGEETVIHDWKTTADPKKWGKTPDQLVVDPQLNLYADYAFREGALRVSGKWCYLPTKGLAVAHPVRVVLARGQVSDVVGKLDETARDVQTLYRLRPKAEELKPNRNACSSYGGCPHRTYCPHPIEELFSGGDTVSNPNPYAAFMTDVDTRLAAPGQPPAPIMATPPAPPAPPARPTYWIPGDEMNDTQKYMAAGGAPLAVIASAATVPPPPAVAATYGAPAIATHALAPIAPPISQVLQELAQPVVLGRPVPEAGFINPPEAPKVAPAQPSEMPIVPATVSQDAAPPSPPDDLDAMSRDQLKPLGISLGAFGADCRRQEPWMRDEIRKMRRAGQAGLPAQGAYTQAMTEEFTAAQFTQPPASPAPVTSFAAPGAPPSQPPVPSAIPPAPSQDAVWTVVTTTGERKAFAQPTPSDRGFDLFINCQPKNYTGAYFTDVLRFVMPKVRELSGVPDYRMVDYGKGAGVLANTVRTYLLEHFDDAAIVVDARSPEGNACLGVLEELARSTTRGF
jgi:hypothetical protein